MAGSGKRVVQLRHSVKSAHAVRSMKVPAR
jgi:hypothetical protein